ncbi:amino acid kinase family protein [Candidatus Methanoperedens nitratireducens]|uniref:Putative archaeal kinase n=1 Tax=Candidatus Methanoperedens nitratireducens TaxID=1392998 RepID=A0A284VK68_9EURY|nr:amino acid kinase [Candidatus Methanoperedens nitroreducens]SNQ59587.1 putative archaeal kinase [Candidatus Methanoperedens nitroreducens]
MIVVKIGGSLLHRTKELVKAITDYSNESGNKVLIVPGGSVFAYTVRRVNASQEASHWMAVLAMEQYGYYLGDGNEVKLIDNLNTEYGVSILLPYTLMKKKDELPHTWDVTSDTIAAWVAHQSKARFIKVTDVDGVYLNGILQKELDASELAGIETCVDKELPRFLMKNRMNCEIINGNCPGRLINALRGNVVGTLIKG